MNNEEKTEETKVEENERRIKPKDIYLEIILGLVEDGDNEFPITLLVHGGCVTGKIIRAKKYYQQFAGGALAEVMKESVKEGHLEAVSPQDADSFGIEETVTKYIHLKDARMFFGAHNPIPKDGSLLRLKIAAIDGYFLNEISVEVA